MKKTALLFTCALTLFSFPALATDMILNVRTEGAPGKGNLATMICDINISSDGAITNPVACGVGGATCTSDPAEPSQKDSIALIRGGTITIHSTVYGGKDHFQMTVTPGKRMDLSASCTFDDGHNETVSLGTDKFEFGHFAKSVDFSIHNTILRAWLSRKK